MNTKKEEKAHQQVLIYLPPALIEKVKQAAQETYRSVSGEVAFILDQYFKQQQNTGEQNPQV